MSKYQNQDEGRIRLKDDELEISCRGDKVIEIPGRLRTLDEQNAQTKPERISLTDREKLEIAKKTILRLSEDAEKLSVGIDALKAEYERLEIENGQLKSENRQLEKNYAEINDLYDELHDQDEALRKAHEALKDRVLAVLLKREEESE